MIRAANAAVVAVVFAVAGDLDQTADVDLVAKDLLCLLTRLFAEKRLLLRRDIFEQINQFLAVSGMFGCQSADDIGALHISSWSRRS